MSSNNPRQLNEQEQLLLDEYDRTKPQDTDFRQQRLRSWQPLLIPFYVVITFIILGCIFLPIGFVILKASDDIVTHEIRYDSLDCAVPGSTKPCAKSLDFTLEEDMDKPVFFYYKLTNFYQNHRRYVKSRSDVQLSGSDPKDVSTCDPLEKHNGVNLYPCGLIAASYFDDTFVAKLTPAGALLPDPTFPEWTEKGIAWDVDREVRFVDKFKNENGTDTLPADLTRTGPRGTIPDLNNEHLMNWMRPAAFPTFKKLYAIINKDLKKGDKLTFDVYDTFDNEQYDGEKSLVLSTASWVGGQSYFLAYLYIAVGAFCFTMALLVFMKQLIWPRKLGNMANMRKLEKIH